MSKLIRNVSTETVQLPDLQGTFLVPNDVMNLDSFSDIAVRTSLSLIHELAEGTIVYSDGAKDFTANDAINLIRGFQQLLATTDNGKQLVISTTRPSNTFAYFTSQGDDVPGNKVGMGDPLIYSVAPGTSQSKIVKFVEQIYFIQGVISYRNAEAGSTLTQEVWCPAGLPFPAPGSHGNYDVDLTTGVATPNATGTGGYYILGTDTLVAKFINNYLLFGDDKAVIRSDDVARLFKGWYMKLIIKNASATKTIDASINMQIYRSRTI